MICLIDNSLTGKLRDPLTLTYGILNVRKIIFFLQMFKSYVIHENKIVMSK